MARIRSIKPEFFKHLELQELECENPGQNIMLVYAGLWTQCDKNGVFFYHAKVIKNEILPYIDFDMKKTLDILEKNSYFIRFKHESREYGHIPNFSKYQLPTKGERESPAKYPEPPINIPDSIPEDTPRDIPEYITEDVTEEVPKNIPDNIPKAEGVWSIDNRSTEEGKRIMESSVSVETTPEHPFSLPQKNKTPREDISTRLERLRVVWNNSGSSPPCQILPTGFSDKMRYIIPVLQAYSDDEISCAIKNYVTILKSEKHDPGGRTGYKFQTFLENGVERYCDAAEPLKNFLKPGQVMEPERKQRQPPPDKCPNCGGEMHMSSQYSVVCIDCREVEFEYVNGEWVRLE